MCVCVCVSVCVCVWVCMCVGVRVCMQCTCALGLSSLINPYFTIMQHTGYTALHWASLGGVKACVKCLVKKNADPNKKDKQVLQQYDQIMEHLHMLYM